MFKATWTPWLSRHALARIAALFGLVAMLGIDGFQSPALAQMDFVTVQGADSPIGPSLAKGAVIWSHGRSVESEDSRAPTPDYIGAFRAAGWDTFRLNRLRFVDTLPASSAVLAGEAEALKRIGYQRVVLAGQSFGAFISVLAAGQSNAVDAVIGTAPAAFGSAESNPKFYGLNATELYEALVAVRHARVALFFFEGDIFDPGGRGPIARQILGERQLTHLIVDRPARLSTHWASAGPDFTLRFAPCLMAFAEDDNARGSLACREAPTAVRIAAVQ